MKPQETKSSDSLAALKSQAGSDPVLEYMLAKKLPLTREHYLALNYPDGVPNPMPGELEMEIPQQLREAHDTVEQTAENPMQPAIDTYENAMLDMATDKPEKDQTK